ncbi:uncharacterized protein LOC143291973 [Babylonia areolata]|uniref:uncharacterized protein LOC143291973 n=1 Tax=Babylonia areolata TaxID=304850 RepID=UPI003FD639F0
MDSGWTRNWLRSCTSLTLALVLLVLHGPVSMQARGSILRRMPIFYGKRDQASSQRLVIPPWGPRLGGQDRHSTVSGYPETRTSLGGRWDSLQTRTIHHDPGVTASRKLSDEEAGVWDVIPLYKKLATYMQKRNDEEQMIKAIVYALEEKKEAFLSPGP